MMQEYVPPEYGKNAFHCPHCGAYAHQEWRWYLHTYSSGSKKGSYRALEKTSASFCERCKNPALWYNRNLLFPLISAAPAPSVDMPDQSKKDYEEARAIFNQSPRGAAALLRLAIQELVIQLGESEENLNVSIGNLVKKGLRVDVQKALDIVRVIGNNAVHPGEIDLNDNPKMALSLFRLANLIVEDMVTKPKEIQQLFEALPEAAREAIDKRDKKKQK